MTFDDGPWPVQTKQVVDILERFHVPGSFFMIGNLVERYPGIVRMVAEAGMRIGDHSWDHPVAPALADLSRERVAEEIGRTADALGSLGVVSRLFRPPGGSFDAAVLREAERQRMRVVTWSVDPRDWNSRTSSRQITHRVLGAVEAGSIVLLHDGGGDQSATIRALPQDHPRHPEDGSSSGRDPEAGVTLWGVGTDVWARNARDRGMSEELSAAERARRNERQRKQYAKEAPKYDKESVSTERWLFGAEHRVWACSRANGNALEVAIGTGLNLPNYPPGVRLTGIDLTPEMLALARTRADDLGILVTFCEGDAQALPFDDGTFDTVLCTYAMCSVPDERRAVLEMKRVLKPGGRLILVDHVRSSVVPIYWVQRLMELAPSRGERELTRRPIMHVRLLGSSSKRPIDCEPESSSAS